MKSEFLLGVTVDKQVTIKLGLAFDLIIQTSEELDLKQWFRYLKPNPKKENEYRAIPFQYPRIKTMFIAKGYKINSTILQDSNFSDNYSTRFDLKIDLRDYQQQALQMFMKNKGRGVVVLPTAAGKTMIGLAAIEKMKQKTLIVVPVLTLLEQWIDRLHRYTALSGDMIGQYGDNIKEIKEITVTTYVSARQNINSLRKHFNFVIFDEVHHLPAEKTIKIAEGFPAEYRLGLTATPDRSDRGEEKLSPLIGPQIVVSKISELAEKGYVSDYELKTIDVELTEKERAEYEGYMETYKGYLRKRKIRIRSPKDFERHLVFRVNIDPEARNALTAHRNARALVFSSKAKIETVGELLEKHEEDQVVIFSEFNDMVYEISKQYLIPAITHETKSKERNTILEKFREGKYTKIVTGRVLDEGWDVKQANVGILVSGTGQARQFIQRLGRLLRPKDETAILYELVTPKTLEEKTSERRKEARVI